MVVISFWDFALVKHRISCRSGPRLNCIIGTCVIAGCTNPFPPENQRTVTNPFLLTESMMAFPNDFTFGVQNDGVRM
jgi:hypothetical protein